MIGLPVVYALAGAMFAAFAVQSFAGRRWKNGLFWGLLAVSFLLGDHIGDIGNGVLALALVAVATSRLAGPKPPTTDAATRERSAERHGNRLFLPALIVPAGTIGGTFLFKALPGLVDPKQATLVALATSAVIGAGVAAAWFRPRIATIAEESVRLMDAVGWATILPQMLTALGALFAAAGIGQVMGGLLGGVIPEGSLIGAVIVYAGGLALLTIALGNAFAAFPVMMAAVGLPLLIRTYHGDPAGVAALGMLAGFCGTLLTPMAANFNIVPVGLLNLSSRYAVIRAQAPTALLLWIATVLLLLGLAFR